MNFNIQEDDKTLVIKSTNKLKVIAMGFTARNQEQMKKNLEALKKEGIEYPSSFPQVYPCIKNVLDSGDEIDVLSENTCGEVEYLILKIKNELFIGVGSDHADKKIEKKSILYSKNICPKPFKNLFWRYSQVRDHWDDLIIRSWQKDGNEFIKYQDSSVSNILQPSHVLKSISSCMDDNEDYIIFCGSVANITGRYIYGEEFIYEIEDPILKRNIKGSYKINNICKVMNQ